MMYESNLPANETLVEKSNAFRELLMQTPDSLEKAIVFGALDFLEEVQHEAGFLPNDLFMQATLQHIKETNINMLPETYDPKNTYANVAFRNNSLAQQAINPHVDHIHKKERRQYKEILQREILEASLPFVSEFLVIEAMSTVGYSVLQAQKDIANDLSVINRDRYLAQNYIIEEYSNVWMVFIGEDYELVEIEQLFEEQNQIDNNPDLMSMQKQKDIHDALTPIEGLNYKRHPEINTFSYLKITDSLNPLQTSCYITLSESYKGIVYSNASRGFKRLDHLK